MPASGLSPPGLLAAESNLELSGDWMKMNRQAAALAREFEAPVGILDSRGRAWRIWLRTRVERLPAVDAAMELATTSLALEQGRVTLWPLEAGSGPVWLVLPLVSSGTPGWTAWVGFASAPNDPPHGDWGVACPKRALIAWGQAVLDRMRVAALSKGSVSALAGSALGEGGQRPLADWLTSRLRVSDAPERFQLLAARSLREVLEVEAIAWVPLQRRDPVVVAGRIEGLATEDYRLLVPETTDEPIQIINRFAQPPVPGVRQVALAAAETDTTTGWLIAINPRDGRPFTDGEVELLQPVASLIGAQRINAQYYSELKDLLFGVIRALTSAVDAKDPYTLGHSERVGRIAVQLGEVLGLSPNERGDLYLMGLLHDVGKIGVDDSILKKPGPLTTDEFCLIQSHVRIGVHILSDLKKLHHLLPGVAHHHENYDGTGYPSGLVGESIPFSARILAVADAFDAMSSTRTYRRRLASNQIDEIFRKGAGTQWDPQVVEALFSCRAQVERIRQKGLGDSVKVAVDETIGRT